MLTTGFKKQPIDEYAFLRIKYGKYKTQSSIAVVAQVVSSETHLSISDIKNKTRKREIVEARQIIMYFAMKLRLGTLQKVGDYFGKDHATVFHAVKTVTNLMETNKEFSTLVGRIENRI